MPLTSDTELHNSSAQKYTFSEQIEIVPDRPTKIIDLFATRRGRVLVQRIKLTSTTSRPQRFDIECAISRFLSWSIGCIHQNDRWLLIQTNKQSQTQNRRLREF